MKKIMLAFFLVFPFVSFAATLEVVVQGVESDDQGKLIARVFQKNQDFPLGKPLLEQKADAQEQQIFSFKDLESESYAVMVFLDENDNGTVDRNFIGLPKEKVTASYKKKRGMGPPSFKDASFKLTSGEAKKIFVKLRN